MKGRIGTKTRLFSLFGGIRSYNKKTMEIYRSILKASNNEIALLRAKILDYAEKYSIKDACDLFGVSKATICRWKKARKEKGGSLSALIPLSRAPKNKRQREFPKVVETFIREYRDKHHGIGKEALKPLCDVFCRAIGLKPVSESTIGRIINDLKKRGVFNERKIKLSINARTGNLCERKTKSKIKKLRRKGYVPEEPGDLVEIDSISIFQDGLKRYVITAVDLKSRFTFAYAYKTLSSISARDFIQKVEMVALFAIKRIQTDNGSEFHKHFLKYLQDEKKTHFFIYPRQPKSNAHIERFNRTIEEQHLNYYEGSIAELNSFNKDLIDYLLWYNLEKPHKSLHYLSPINYILLNFEHVIKKDYTNPSPVSVEFPNDFVSFPFIPKKSQMLWTSTRT